MPQFRASTLEAIRLDIGLTLGVVQQHTTTSTGSTTTVVSTTLRGGTNDHKGKWVRITSGTEDESVRQVTAFDGTATLTVDAFGNTIATSVTFELWDQDIKPTNIDQLINRAVDMAYRKSSVALESVTAASLRVARYAVPTNMIGVEDIYYRTKVTGISVLPGGVAFDGTVDADITSTKDDQDYRWGNSSSKFVVADAAGGGETAAHTIDSKDLSSLDTIEFWAKSDGTAIVAGDLKLQLHATGASVKETLSIGALSARIWTFQRLSLANPEDDTAIVSVVFEYDQDEGAIDAWLNDINAVRDDSGTFKKLHKNFWRVDKQTDEIIFTQDAVDIIGNKVIRIVGRQAPTALTADATVTEVDPEFLTPMVLSWAYQQRTNRRGDRNDASAQLWEQQRQIAELRLARMQSPTSGIRWTS